MYIRHLLLSSTVVAMLGSMATAVPVPGFLKRATHNEKAASTAKDCSTVVHNTTLTSTPFYITFNGTIAGQPCASINGSISQFTLHSRNSTDMLQAVNLNGTSINGTSCDITIPDSRYQQINGNNVFVFVPLISADGNKTSINCGNSKEAVPLNVNLAAYNIPGINSTTPTTTTTTEDHKPTPTPQHHEQHTTTTTTTTTHEPTHTHTHHHTTTTTTTTTTTHHAAATHDSNGGGGQTFKGIGTWFIPATEGGSQGACGPFESNTEMIGALNAPQYGDINGKSSWCGKKVKVTVGDKSIIITINDACPECAHGSIDLTQAAFLKLGALDIGVLPISWTLA